MPQFDWLYDVCGCMMSPTLGIYWVELDFINNYKELQLWLVLLSCDALIWLCDVCGCVMIPTSGIYWVELNFINNYKEP